MAVNVDYAYSYKKLTVRKWSEPGTKVSTSYYKFFGKRDSSGSKFRYNVEVEEHSEHLYILKFYQHRHKDLSNGVRYRIVTESNEAFGVLSTCLSIALDIYRKDPLASFGFVGASSIGEGRENNVRYRIYRMIMADNFNPDEFEHAEDSSRSLYVAINRKAEVVDLWQQIITELDNEYNENYQDDNFSFTGNTTR